MNILDYINRINELYGNQEPRNMELAKAEIPRHLWDNFNTPDLEQSEFLRPGETLETWKPNPFLKPHAEGGRIGLQGGQLVTPSVDGSRPGYKSVGQPRKFDLEAVEKAINSANSKFKYTSLDNLAKQIDGVSDASHLKGIIKRQNLPGLDSYAIKAEKAFIELFKDSSRNADEVIKPLHKIAEMIGISEGKERVRIENISNALKKSKVLNYAEDVKPLINKLSSANFIEKIKGKDWNITDVEHSIYNKTMLRAPKTDAEHLMTYVIRHQDQAGGDAIFNIFDGKSGKRITDMSQVDSYHDIIFKDSKGKVYDMDYMTRKGRTDPMFKEYFDLQDKLVDMKNRKYWPDGSKIIDHTGKHVTFGNYSGSMYKHGYGYKKPYERFPYETDHLNLKKHPFKNLTILPQRINVAIGAADRLKKPDIKYKIGGEHFRNLSIDDLMTQEKALGEKILIFDEKGNHIGKKLKTSYTAAKIKAEKPIIQSFSEKIRPKGSGVQLSSVGGVFDEALKSKAFKKGWRGFRKVGGPWELGFIGADFINNLDRMDADTAFKTALENATLGMYEGGKRAQWKNFETAGKELGHNPENLNEIKSIMDLEKMLTGEKQVLEEMIAYNQTDPKTHFPEEEIKWRKDVVARLEKEFENKQNTFWSKDNAQDLAKNYEDTVSYIARKEYNKNWEDKKFRVDTDMGPIGSPLWSAITDWGVIGDKKGIPYPKTLLPQNLMETTSVTRPYVRALRKTPFIGKFFNPTSKEAKLSAMSDEEKAQRAKELNVQEQYYHPVTGNTMTYSQMEPYYDKYYASGGRAGYMGGGIAAIRKPHAIPPERQGLRSIMINVNDD